MSVSRNKEIGLANWRDFASSTVDPSEWTALVPAAGRGSRLGFHRPKILCPVAGRLTLEWLLDFLRPNCARCLFVLSPEGRSEVALELERLIPGRYGIAIQEVPRGMGDAVECALSQVETPHVAVVWGDQVALRPSSVEACLRLHRGPLAPALTCPTVFRSKPYIHFDRDASGAITGLRQAREGDAMPEYGESDTGFFCFRTEALRSLLASLRLDSGRTGRMTGEANFLPVIPLAARSGFTVLTPALMTLEETIGINTAGDIGNVEDFLRQSHASPGLHAR